MKHLIFGNGNLGCDLAMTINSQENDEAVLLTRSNGYEVTLITSYWPEILAIDPDVVWYCVGFGSVKEAVADPETARAIHVNLAEHLAKRLPDGKRLILFSTDYCADHEEADNPRAQTRYSKSFYANLKIEMENLIDHFNRPQTAVIRVGSLYGHHKPDKTFPGKVLNNFAYNENQSITLPSNYVTPTPTRWAARMLVTHLDKLTNNDHATRHHLAPLGNVSVSDWAKMILDGLVDPKQFNQFLYVDQERPIWSNLKCSFAEAPYWFRLWEEYFDREAFLSR